MENMKVTKEEKEKIEEARRQKRIDQENIDWFDQYDACYCDDHQPWND